jgi:hypothetical protein
MDRRAFMAMLVVGVDSLDASRHRAKRQIANPGRGARTGRGSRSSAIARNGIANAWSSWDGFVGTGNE